MISTKRITQLAKKWQRMAALKKRLSWRTTKDVDECCTSVASKGHCVVYSADGKRFEVPLEYLSTAVIAQLLQISLEEFGFMSDGPITLPCDASHGVRHVPAGQKRLYRGSEGILEHNGCAMPLWKLCRTFCRS